MEYPKINKLETILNYLAKSIRDYPLILLCFIFILTAKGHLEIIDTDYSLKTALSILENGSLRIKASDKDYIMFSVNANEDGLIYSQYGIGLPILFIPFIIVAQLVSTFINIPELVLTNFLISFYNIPFAILGLWFIREILQNIGVKKYQANSTVVIIALCTAYWHYTVIDFSEITQLSLLLGCINATISKSNNKWRYFSISFSFLISIKIAYLILLPIFIIYGLIESKQRPDRLIKDILNGTSFILPTGILIGFLNYVRFGSITEFGYGGNPGFGFSFDKFYNMCIPSIISIDYGIIPFNPILLLFPLWFKIIRNNRAFSYLTISIIAMWFVFMTSYNYGWGWSWGQRYLFVIIPLIALSIAFLPTIKFNNFKIATISLITFGSCFIQLISVATKIHEPLTMRVEYNNKTNESSLGQLPSTISLFKHKLLDGSANYPLSIIGGDPNKSIDLTHYNSFLGFNFWPIHTLKFLKLNHLIRLTEITLLSLIIILIIAMLKIHLQNLISGNKFIDC